MKCWFYKFYADRLQILETSTSSAPGDIWLNATKLEVISGHSAVEIRLVTRLNKMPVD